MGRRKLTQEEVEARNQEKQEELTNIKNELKEIIDNLDEKLLIDYVKTCNTYDGLTQEEIFTLLIKKFAKKDFEFKQVIKYE